MTRQKAARLHVGADADTTVVSLVAVRLRSGRARHRRAGSVNHVVPVPPSGRSRAQRTRTAVRLGAVLATLCTVLAALGVPWLLPAAVAVLLLGQFVRDQARAAAPGVLALPGPQVAAHVLHAVPDRQTFARCVAMADRIRATWPALRDMIDPGVAEPLLRRALWELAGVLGRRQEIRRLRAELGDVRLTGLPADSPAVRALREQRAEVERLWRDADADVERHCARLRTAVAAGEDLIREQQVGRTARDAQLVLARLSTAGAPVAGAAGEDLADRTAAVTAAYRELAARYGAG